MTVPAALTVNRGVWFLFALWVALLGVQLPAPVSNLRVAPGDLLLVVTLGAVMVTDWRLIFRSVWPITPVVGAVLVLAAALVWGSVVALLRTEVLIQEAWLNKGVGALVLGAIVVVTRAAVQSGERVRAALSVLLTAGTITAWLGVVVVLVIPLFTGVFFPVLTGGPLFVRFGGFLLNPTANALYLSVLILLQVASICGSRVVGWPRQAQYANAFGLSILLILTLSRSTWLATILALLVMAAFMVRTERRAPLLIAFFVLAFAANSLSAVLSPAIERVARGDLSSQRGTSARGIPPENLVDITRPVVSGAPAPTPSPSHTAAPTPSPLAAPTPTADRRVVAAGSPVPPREAIRQALLSAIDRHGATDRLALDAVAIRLWLSDPLTAIVGIGLGVFFQVTPFTQFGTNLIIHSTYVWMPVEMGVAGIAALVALGASGWMISRRLAQRQDLLLPALAAPLVLFALWLGMNEGSYQRLLWLLLGLGSVLVWPPSDVASPRADLP